MKARLRAFVLLAPALLALGAVAVWPVLATVWLSLRRVFVVFQDDRFVGLANFAFVLEDARFLSALGNTLYFTAVAVALETALGLGFALLLHRRAPGHGVLRASVLVPWAIPTVVSAKLWALLFDPTLGVITRVLPVEDGTLLGVPGWAMHAAILVDVWKTTPFVALLLHAGLSSIPEDVHRAAALDGAGPVRTFVKITLPLLRPTIAVTVVLRALDAFRVFDAVYVLTDGGPANTTETLSIYAYKTLMRSGDFGYGSALGVVTFVCVIALGLVLARVLGARGAEARHT